VDIKADDFNDLYDVGTPVFFWPGWRKDENGKDIPAMVSETSTPAWEMPGGQQVVTVKGRAGGMWLEHIEVIPDYVLQHLKTPEDEDAVREAQAAQHRAETHLALVGMEVESHGDALLKSLAPFYQRQNTTCDGKCAKVEDLTEQLEEALTSAQRRASEWEAESERVGREYDRVKEESAARMQEIDRLRGIVRLDQQQQTRNQGTFAVYQGVIAKKEEELGEAAAKIDELRGMLGTQHARLTVLEGDLGSKTRDYNNIEAKFVEARQKEDQLAEEVNKLQHERSCALTVINPKLDPFSSKRSLINETTELANRAEVLAADLADCQEERERIYTLLDPETDIDDRRFGPVDLLHNLLDAKEEAEKALRDKYAENLNWGTLHQQLGTQKATIDALTEENQQLKENPHKGCRQLEAGLNAKLQAAEKERANAFQKLDELRNQVLDVVRDNVRARPSD
jgi:DNA repair exonuclease SbcCD ATPase subunit